ncbi:hypothetical protein HDU96_010084, partial [Phlyctochytrium bullatum]
MQPTAAPVKVEMKTEEEIEFDETKTEESDLFRVKTEDHADWLAVKKEDPDVVVKKEDLVEVKEDPDLTVKREDARMMNVKQEEPFDMDDSNVLKKEEPPSTQIDGGHASDELESRSLDFEGDDDQEATFERDNEPPASAVGDMLDELSVAEPDCDASDMQLEDSSALSVLSSLLSAPTLETWMADQLAVPIDGEAPELPHSPMIEVEGLGILPLPLVDTTAAQLAALCEAGPRTQTFALSAEKFTITHPEWHSGLENLMSVLSKRLGFDGNRLPVKLRKMMLHQPGPASSKDRRKYRDSEDQDSVLATLVVQLCSSYRGGKLVLEHKAGGKSVHGLGMLKSAEAVSMNYYAVHIPDAQHRVADITKGHCLMLV